MNYKIGVFGAAVPGNRELKNKAEELGKALARAKVTIITGAGKGLPYLVSLAAYGEGAEIWGFSPSTGRLAHRRQYPENEVTIYKKLFFVPQNYRLVKDIMACKKYRNISSTQACDAGILISGRWGTLNEFTNLYDMGKIIGLLVGSGGVSDELPELIKKIKKNTGAKVVTDRSAEQLVRKVIDELSKKA